MTETAQPPRGVQQLVVVGSSAGGIEALSELVKALPEDLPAPVVIAQHIDPTRESHLPEILSRHTALSVRTVTSREPLESGVVFVVPADRHVQITDHSVGLSTDSSSRPKPSVNLLLTSAAEAFGERLIAIILSGTGSDGAVGAAAVKQAGGTVIIQNPETARYPGMPRSLAPAIVDIVAELEDIGPMVSSLLAGDATSPPPPEVERQVRGVLDELRVLKGVDFNSYRTPMLERRLQRRLAATKMPDLSAYRSYLRQHPEEQDELTRAFLIKVTEFFRDAELFAYMRERLLPRLVMEAQEHGNELRLWSAGCATGQEAYSLAMLLAEQLGNELERLQVRIFATDLDAGALEFARRGVYPRTAVEHLPAGILERYFTRTDGEYEVSKRIRGLIVFGVHDLGQRAPFPHMDLVLCRNVLMYFTPELQRRALHLFAFALRDRGALVLGKSETLSPLPEYFEREQQHLRIYRRHGDRALIPAALALSDHGAGGPQLAARESRKDQGQHTGSAGSEAGATTVLDIPIGLVNIDVKYDIVAINPAARRLLGIHIPGAGEDLLHLLHTVDANQVRHGIDSVFATGQPFKLERLPVVDPTSEEPRVLDLAFYPAENAGNQAPMTLTITVAESPPVKVEATKIQPELAREDSVELRRRLDAALQLLADVQSANDRLLVVNEELVQSRQQLMTNSFAIEAASEEVETLNEELHATNEELETLNEEMQSTLEELQATNDDLAVQTTELQRLSLEHEAQRRRLEIMLNSIGDAVLVVDAHGAPMLANPAYHTLFGGLAAGFTAERPDGTPIHPVEAPLQRAARGEEFSMEFVAQAADGSRRWLEALGRPFQLEDETQSILVIRDVTDRSLRQLQERFLAVAGHELRTPLTSLLGNAQLLKRALENSSASPDLLQPVDTIIEQAHRLQSLASDLTDANRLHGERIELTVSSVDVVQLVTHAVELERPLADGRAIRLEAPAEPLRIEADQGRLEQVLINLLDNALVHAPESDVDVRLRTDGDWVEIAVQDDGPGIPERELPHLFTPFFQVRHMQAGREGMGLGLYISHELVAAHGGTLDVRSVERKGATFIVRLPRSAPSER